MRFKDRMKIMFAASPVELFGAPISVPTPPPVAQATSRPQLTPTQSSNAHDGQPKVSRQAEQHVPAAEEQQKIVNLKSPIIPSAPPYPQVTMTAYQQSADQSAAIGDKFTSLSGVQKALRRQGLESSNLIFAIDFTKSNTWLGEGSFGGHNLHHIEDDVLNPYQAVCQIIARTLEDFDDDQLYPAYGFGDLTSKDKAVFSFKPGDEPCDGLDELVQQYRAVAQGVVLKGPTSFAPAIYQALRIVAESGGQYHILVIIADGQVTQEGPTVKAIVEASNYPLSIIMVGVGDGPWDQQHEFDDRLPQRRFDNFHFVNAMALFQETCRQPPECREAKFALKALMEIPDQYESIRRLNLLGVSPPPSLLASKPPPLPPPARVEQYRAAAAASDRLNGTQQRPPERVAVSSNAPSYPKRALAYDTGLFECPITQAVMEDPVIAQDGRTYERFAIEQYLAGQGDPWRSPMTGQPVSGKQVIPNLDLRSRIREYADMMARQEQ